MYFPKPGLPSNTRSAYIGKMEAKYFNSGAKISGEYNTKQEKKG